MKKYLSLVLCIMLLIGILPSEAVLAKTATAYENSFENDPGSEWTLQGSMTDRNHAAYDAENSAIDIVNKQPLETRTAKLNLANVLAEDETVMSMVVTPTDTDDVKHVRLKLKFYDSKNAVSHQVMLLVDNQQRFAITNTSNVGLTPNKIDCDYTTPIKIDIEFKFSEGKARYRMYELEGEESDWSDYVSLQADGGAEREIKAIVFSNEYLDCNIRLNSINITAPVPKLPPVARNVSITGYDVAPKVGDKLIGGYDYYSAQGDAEGETRIRWYRTDSSAGVTDADIISEGDLEYEVTDADEGKYIWFEVLPISEAEPSIGTAVRKMLSMRYTIDIEDDINAIEVPEETDEDIYLPEIGQNGSLITWESSNRAIIDVNGTVRPANDDTVVTLTATVTNSGISKTKSFDVKVNGISILDEDGNPKNLALNKDIIKANMVYNSPSVLEPGQRQYMYINDGTTQTSMRSTYGSTMSFTIDLGRVYSVNRFITREQQSAVSSYTIEGSVDDSDYFMIISDGKEIGASKVDDFDGVALRYVRFTQTGTKFPQQGTSSGSPTIIGEFEVYNVPYAPEITGDVTIESSSGDHTLRVGDTISPIYKYYDKNSDPEQGTEYKWMRSENEAFTDYEVVGTNKEYKLADDDLWKYFAVEVTPHTALDPTDGEPVTSKATGFVCPSKDEVCPPVALNLKLDGKLYSGRTVSASYTYYDNLDAQESDTFIRWLASESENGLYTVLKSGKGDEEDILSYTIADKDISKFLKVEITPKNKDREGVPTELVAGKIIKDPIIADLDALSIPASADKDIILPIRGNNGSAITWESSNPSVLGPDGTVRRTSSAVAVTLTASAELEGTTFTREYKVTVKASSANIGGGGGGGGSGNRGSAASSGSSGTSGNGYVPSDIDKIELDAFDDLTDVPWAKEYIKKLAQKDIISGTGNGRFEPNKAVTREEFVKIIVKAFDFKTNDVKSKFSDVPEGQWYKGYVDIAFGNGLINGISDDMFGTGKNITRADICVIISRALAAKGIEIKQINDKNVFSDDSDIPAYAADSVYMLQRADIISGTGDNNFSPMKNATRAEVAKIVCCAMEGSL